MCSGKEKLIQYHVVKLSCSLNGSTVHYNGSVLNINGPHCFKKIQEAPFKTEKHRHTANAFLTKKPASME